MSERKQEDYLTRTMVRDVLKQLIACHENYQDYRRLSGLGKATDIGRRNNVLSEAPEKFLANVLKRKFPLAAADGRSGAHDIIIPELGDKHLECKLTSRFDLQVDVTTLKNKQPLDHVFFIVNETFDGFVVLHFQGLTVDDFHRPSPRSKGKASMIKHRAMKRCRVLYGNIIDENARHVFNAKLEMIATTEKYHRVVEKTKNRRSNKEGIPSMLSVHKERFNGKICALKRRIKRWRAKDTRYSLFFESVWDDSLEFETTIDFPEINF